MEQFTGLGNLGSSDVILLLLVGLWEFYNKSELCTVAYSFFTFAVIVDTDTYKPAELNLTSQLQIG